ncbi:MAG: hypothetical protein FJY92_10945 [Candidatus Hydrogenedentes bacterium]|nr:hypothetical protein [Candidatus Hydrogenedentota bacterium]
MWNRLLWDPSQSLDDVLRDYCTYQFGPDAAPLMVDALKTMEKELETPVEDNGGIRWYYELVRDTRETVPDNLMRRDHRWRMHMQHAALGCHLQLRVRKELDREARARAALAGGLKSGNLDDAVRDAIAILRESASTPEMDALREEARVLGEETNALFGIRDVGYFRNDRTLRDLPGHIATLENALAAKSRAEKRTLMQRCIDDTTKPTRAGNIFG